jgi:hypothetical protein
MSQLSHETGQLKWAGERQGASALSGRIVPSTDTKCEQQPDVLRRRAGLRHCDRLTNLPLKYFAPISTSEVYVVSPHLFISLAG